MELIRLLIMAISFFGVFLGSSNMIKYNAACNPREREALINFKSNLDDRSNKLSSWVGNDCCNWNGVICKNKTEGDVVELQLAYFWLSGKLNSSLLELKHLYHLDLSWNRFFGNQIPAFLGSLQNLRHLDLVGNRFTGKVPPQLGNLSSLYYLDMSVNELEGEIPRTLGNLCNLNLLRLSTNKLQGVILSRLLTNSSRCFGSKLKSLNLGYNQLSGGLPDELGSLENLEELILLGNSFSGSIPMSLGRLSLLRRLYLSDNKLNGSLLPESFEHLTNLGVLAISNNMLEGDVTEAHFVNLKKLHTLEISSMVLTLSPDWVPPFQLQDLKLQNCSVGNRFPEWLRTQKGVLAIDISNAGISGSIPSWFWNMTFQLQHLNISHNELEGNLSNMSLKKNSGNIILNSNRFTGNLPLISSRVAILDLSKNNLSGPISDLLCNPTEDMNSLQALDLSENQLSGMLPDCWFAWRSLFLIRLQRNNITGQVPSSMGFLSELQMLHLQENSLSGELPSSLQNCTKLGVIDLGENRLTGAIPTWIGESLGGKLRVLRLRSNKFHGEIPQKLCYLNRLQVLDMGHNNLSGSIPKCFSNFSTMASNGYPNSSVFSYTLLRQKNTLDFVAKGKDMVYGDSLINLVAGIDLSNNKLYGKIPEELMYLFGLRTLNLANNSFTGAIPKGIGHLNLLESLDLSNNRLSGSIPQSLANLTFLSYLNVSSNNLSGKIPSGAQLQTFNELSYLRNHDLCGSPLMECGKDRQPEKTPNGNGQGPMEGDEDEDWIEMKWFYMGLPFGFVVGFWCLWGILLVKKSWRYAYFRFINDIINSLCTCLKQNNK